jgi:alpha-L-rhamnosidase
VLQGATTMWERWNSYTIKRGFGPVDMNSFNHYSFGAIEEWMFSYMLGIRPVESDPGYHSFILEPRPGGTIRYARGSYDTVYGRIESSWHWLEGDDGVEYEFVIPANTSARLQLPASEGVYCEVLEGGEFAEVLGEEGSGGYLLPSGHYVFRVR